MHKLKGETLVFPVLWLVPITASLILRYSYDVQGEHMNVCLFSNFYYIRRQNDPSETI